MKRTVLYTAMIAAGMLTMNSCAFFELDNYDAPEETLKGRVVDMDGNRIDKLLVTPPGNKGGEDQQ